MKAAVVTDFHSPLEIQDLPIPEPGPGEVLVRIETSGLCHTDIHAAHGDWPVKPTPPFIPGHEGIGIIEKLGAGVSTRAVGDRVAIAWLGYACGECRYCIGGWETLCLKQENSGYSVNGTFAEYALAPAAFATPVPDAISSRDGAPLTCAGVTTFKAIKVAGVVPGETVAIFGVGGLGHLALQYARIAGGFVIGVDIEDTKLAMATELGADRDRSAQPISHLQGRSSAAQMLRSPLFHRQQVFDRDLQLYYAILGAAKCHPRLPKATHPTLHLIFDLPSSAARPSSVLSSERATTSPTSSPYMRPGAPRSSRYLTRPENRD